MQYYTVIFDPNIRVICYIISHIIRVNQKTQVLVFK